MFFPVRCIFWLTLVYTSITWPGVMPGASSGAAGLAANALSSATAAVTTAATDVCLASPGACADKIALLSHLADDIVPLPVARPASAAQVRVDTLRADDRAAAPARIHRPG